MTHVKFNHIEIRNIKTILKQYIDAEDDTVELRQLLLDYTNLQEILNNL